MNEVLRQLNERKSVRAFENREIPAEDVRAILNAAAQAPTAGNQQLYTILHIADPAIKARLAQLCDNQPFIAKAPLVLAFCADVQRWIDAYVEAGIEPRLPRAGDFLLAVDDALISAQNAVVAAHALGLGSCYIGDVMERCEDMRALLHMPEYVFPAALLVFGVPTAQQKERAKPPRAPLESIVQRDTYRRRSGEEIRAMFEGRTGAKAYDDWMRAFHDRKYASDFSVEMSRSMEEYLKAYGVEFLR